MLSKLLWCREAGLACPCCSGWFPSWSWARSRLGRLTRSSVPGLCAYSWEGLQGRAAGCGAAPGGLACAGQCS